jgi:hypothetical protein
VARHSSSKPTKPRSVVPIQDMIETIRGYPDKLVIFKVPASEFWWMRTYDGRPIKRSTKTTDKREAIKAAKAFYDEVLLNKTLGKSNNPRVTSFTECAQSVMKEDGEKVARGELNEKYIVSQNNMIRKHILPFFSRKEVADIDYGALDSFKTHLFKQNLAGTSIKIIFVAVKKILDQAQRRNLIKSAPLLPKVKKEDNARGFFSVREYLHLRRKALELQNSTSEVKQAGIKDGQTVEKKLRNIVIGSEIQHLIPFMVYSFIRPTDVKNMKHRHIEVRKGENGDYLWMPLPESKRHDKPMTSMPRAAICYKRLRAERLAQLGDPSKDIGDEYVFEPDQANRDYAYRKLTRQFDVILDAAGLRIGPDGEERTLYSLRHTSLMYRLKYGGEINPLMLANNARTSMDMLERFYLSRLESSHFTDDLHAPKAAKRQRRQKAIVTGPPIQPVVTRVPFDPKLLPDEFQKPVLVWRDGAFRKPEE